MLSKVCWDTFVRQCWPYIHPQCSKSVHHWRILASFCNSSTSYQHMNSPYSCSQDTKSNKQIPNHVVIIHHYHHSRGKSLWPSKSYPTTYCTKSSLLPSRNPVLSLIPCQTFRTSAGYQAMRKGVADHEGHLKNNMSSDNGMMLYMAAENGYLSWMRNTYIMTVVLVGLINLNLGPLGPTVCTATSLTAIFNMVVGSSGFIFNLASICRRGHISRMKCVFSQMAVILHLFFWLTVLGLLLLEFASEFEKNNDVDDRLIVYTEDEETKRK